MKNDRNLERAKEMNAIKQWLNAQIYLYAPTMWTSRWNTYKIYTQMIKL